MINLILKGAIYSRFPKQVEFADAVDVSPAYVTMVMRGQRRLPEKRLATWASTLGINPKALKSLTRKRKKGGDKK